MLTNRHSAELLTFNKMNLILKMTMMKNAFNNNLLDK